MSATAILPPPQLTSARTPALGTMARLRRFTVAEYHRMNEIGLLTENDKVELINGYVVRKMSRNPPHDGSLNSLKDLIAAVLPPGWRSRVQSAVILSDSVPEPDLAIVRGDRRTYFARHPGAADFGIVIEVADSSLDYDRTDKLVMYAQDGVPEYRIVNIPELQVEVYTSPQSAALEPRYVVRTDYPAGASVPVVLDGQTIAMIPVSEMLP